LIAGEAIISSTVLNLGVAGGTIVTFSSAFFCLAAVLEWVLEAALEEAGEVVFDNILESTLDGETDAVGGWLEAVVPDAKLGFAVVEDELEGNAVLEDKPASVFVIELVLVTGELSGTVAALLGVGLETVAELAAVLAAAAAAGVELVATLGMALLAEIDEVLESELRGNLDTEAPLPFLEFNKEENDGEPFAALITGGVVLVVEALGTEVV
jgi:hypothetical protein